MFHVTRDKWHMTRSIWHITCDTWHMTDDGRETFSQNFSSLAFTVWEWRFIEDISTKDEFIHKLISKGGVCWKTRATPSLLIICHTLVCIAQRSEHSVSRYLYCYAVFTKFVFSGGLSLTSNNFKTNPKYVCLVLTLILTQALW